MKKLKLFLCIALFGAISLGAFSAYNHLTMSDAEKALLENIEALSSNETDYTYCPGGFRLCAEGQGIRFYQR